MSERDEVVLKSRFGEASERIFHPRDFPELWRQGKGRKGLGVFTEVMRRDPDSPEAAAIWEMLVPQELGIVDAGESHLYFPSGNQGKFDLAASGDRFEIGEFDGWIDAANGNVPSMMQVSSYFDVTFDVHGGSQAFYRNLLYQLGHMDVPIMYGQKNPDSLAYFIHRVGQVPVALLDERFKAIQNELLTKTARSLETMRSNFPAFSYTVAMHGMEPAQLLAPQYREPMHRLQTLFDGMSEEDRMSSAYRDALRNEFGLTDR